MDIWNVTKIIAAVITIIVPLLVGARVFTLDKKNWLNRWFTLFFVFGSFGFMFYTIYHLILDNASIIIPLMITAQFCFNFISISLLMTVFILEKYAKVAMSPKYLVIVSLIFIIMSIGYLIWPPKLDMVSYSLGIVNTETEIGLLIFVNLSRIIILVYAIYRYVLIANKLEGDSKKRIQWFNAGVIIVVLGLLLNLAGGALNSIPIELIALFAIDIGSIVIFKGFLI